MNSIRLKTRLAAAAAMALALAACKDDGPRASAAQGLPLPVLDASMPYAPPAPVERYAPERGYRLAERAYGVQRAVYETRPDYAFDYGDEESLAWETADDWSMYAEPWDDGYRYYYYEPGARYPYFVRDDDYGYGYNGAGVLVAVVDARGRYLPAEDFRRVAPLAGRYYVRGHDLRDAGLRGERLRVDDRVWTDRAPRVRRSADPWLSAARDDGDWRRWREADRNRELDRFTAEQVRRAQAQRTWANGRDPAAIRAQQDHAAREAEREAQRAGFDGRARAEAQQQRAQLAQAEQRRQVQQAQADRQLRQTEHLDQVRAQQAARQQAQIAQRAQQHAREEDQQRRVAEQRQARAEHDRQGAERAQQARAQQAERERGQQQALAAQRGQQQARAAEQQRAAQQARAEHERQGAERAQQARAEQAARQQQAQAQAQARSAEQAARAAAAHERAAPNPGKPPAAQAPANPHGKPHGKPDDRGDRKDRKD